MMVPVFRLAVFFALITSVFAAGTLDALVIAAQGFALPIQQQRPMFLCVPECVQTAITKQFEN
jgi:hypothetical protein